MAIKKNTQTKTQTKPKREYIKAADAMGSAAYLEKSDMWLKSGKYDAPSVIINTGDSQAVSDWARHITLVDVTLEVVENDKGYPELIIKGGNCEDLQF